MKASSFNELAPGQLVRTDRDALAFVPDPLPRELDLPGSTIRLLSRANHAVGELSGVSRSLKNPYLLGSALLRREAILSSRIEGTVTTSEQLVLFEAGARVDSEQERNDAREVLNYVEAMNHGLRRLKAIPVSLRLIRELHAKLMKGVRGHHEQPGEFRRSQNFIAHHGATIEEARYVPPPVREMHEALDRFEKYLHVEPHAGTNGAVDFDEDPDLPPLLIRIGLLHYQFEAIHPFRDGNGRVGRLLIPLLLVSHGRLHAPLLYLSSYFERNREAYYDLLLGVSQRGHWTEWLDFFLKGMIESSIESVDKADKLIALRDSWRSEFEHARSSVLLHKLIDQLFMSPALTIGDAARSLRVTVPSASKNVKKLVDAGILTERTGRKWGQIFVAHDIVQLIDRRTERKRSR